MSVSVPRVIVLIAATAAIGLVAVSAPAAAQADVVFVDSNVTADTTWSAADGPYRLVGNVTVASNATVTIESGTTVQFAEGVTLAVAGELEANGTAEEPVRMTASRALQTPGAWGSLRTAGSAESKITLAHTELEYATDGIVVENPDSAISLSQTTLQTLDGNGIEVDRSSGKTDLSVVESVIQDVDGTGITAAKTDLVPVDRIGDWEIRNSRFEGAETGISLDAERVTGLTVRSNRFERIETIAVRIDTERARASNIRGNRMNGSDLGVALETADVSAVSIRDNVLRETETGLDIHLEQNIHALTIRNNQFDRGGTGVALRHDPRDDGYYSFDLSVIGNEIRNQDRHGLNLQTQTFSDSQIQLANNTLAGNGYNGARLAVGGFQDAVVADNRILDNDRTGVSMTARHVRNTQLEGNVVRENDRSGVLLTADESMKGVRIRENELLDNRGEGLVVHSGEGGSGNYSVTDNVIAANAYGVVLAGSQPGILQSNAIVFNTVAFPPPESRTDAGTGIGVLMNEGAEDVELAENDIYGNRIGLLTRLDGTVSAADNYWGAESGPYHRSINPEGEGNAVETEQGWVELVEARTHRTGDVYARPTAAVRVTPNPAAPAESVVVSAAQSMDTDGTISTYWFTVAGDKNLTSVAERTATFDAVGTYPISVWVEDDMGIESSEPATTALAVREPPETTTPPTTVEPTTREPTTKPTTRQPTTIVTTPPPAESGPGLIGWVIGLLGAVFYGTALVFGARGMYQTITQQPLTVRGRRLHVLAGVGVLIWGLGSILGPGVLGIVAAVGLVAWLVLLGSAFLLVRSLR